MGEKDYQQFFLVKNFIEKNYKTKVIACKTIRDVNQVALSSRNRLLKRTNLNKLGLISKELLNLKKKIFQNKYKSQILIHSLKKKLVKKYKVKIEYLECRNIFNLSANIHSKSFKLFVAYYLDNVRLIDNF